MKNKIAISVNEETYRKLKLLSVENRIEMSDIVRVLINSSSIKVSDVRSKGHVVKDVHNGISSKKMIIVNLDSDTTNKLIKMKLKNNASYPEIIRCLIKGADFSKLNFVEDNNSERNVTVFLDDSSYRKIKDFGTMNFISLHEIVEVLIKSSDIKVKNIEDVSELYKRSKSRICKHSVAFYLSEELYIKMRRMRIKNGATNSKIIRNLVKNGDLDKLKFKSKSSNYIRKERDIATRKRVSIQLYNNTYRKIKTFGAKNNISIAEIMRVLVENSSINVNVRTKSQVIIDSSRKNIKLINVVIYPDKKLLQKINLMIVKNNSTASEILRVLIDNADFKKMKFRTINEVYSIAHTLRAERMKKLKK